MIRVVVVEDSAVQREIIVSRLNSEPDINVVAAVASGTECLRVVPRLRPNMVVLDGKLPDIPGYEVTGRLLELYPVPVVLYTANPQEYQALSEVSGVVATVDKEGGIEDTYPTLVRVIRLMNGMTVIRRIPRRSMNGHCRRYLLIASSSGGPLVVENLLRTLEPSERMSIVLVQHLSESATPTFSHWLESVTRWKCEVVGPVTEFEPGKVYMGPAGHHLLFNGRRLVLQKAVSGNGFAPSADKLFQSFAKHGARESVAVVLSGMGSDGAQGLLDLRLSGAVTLVQDPTTAAVSGMPESAIGLGAALRVVETSKLGEAISGYFQEMGGV